MKEKIENIINNWLAEKEDEFSGILSAAGTDGIIYQTCHGHRNKAEQLPNLPDTTFAIASGTKLFTGLAICKLIDEGKISLDDNLAKIFPHDLGEIDKEITIFQLLTHTSGVGDYIDEDHDDIDQLLEDLYAKYPCYLWENMDYYLQMSTPLPAKFNPGERFGYSNSGYVLLGLVVEAVSGMSYQKFVEDNIINPCNLTKTGFFRMDALPPNTALGYMWNEDTDEWKSNIFSVPIRGGSDGGIFSCAADLDKLWRAIFAQKILSPEMTEQFLKAHVDIEDDGSETYGLGVYQYVEDDKQVFFAIGFDAGVGFLSCYFPKTQTSVTALRNFSDGDNYDLIGELLEVLG